MPAHAECDADALCPASGCIITGTHLLDDDCALDFKTKAVTVGSAAKLKTSNPDTFLTIHAGSFDVKGYLQAASGGLDIEVDSDLKVAATGTISADALAASTQAASIYILAGGAVTLLGALSADAAGTTSIYGGEIYVDAASIDIEKSLHSNGINGGDGGYIHLSATGPLTIKALVASKGGGGGFGGTIEIYSEGSLLLATSGDAVNADGSNGGAGGEIHLESDVDVTVNGALSASGLGTMADGGFVTIYGDTLTVSKAIDTNGQSGGSGGEIDMSPNGDAVISANLSAKGVGTNATGGVIDVDAGGLTVSSDWSVDAGVGGKAGSIDAVARGNPLTFEATSSLSASSSSGGSGGRISFWGAWSGNDVTVKGTVKANSAGAGAQAGAITVKAYPSKKIAVSGTLEASAGTTGLADGLITIGPACDVVVSGTLRSRASTLATGASGSSGKNIVIYHGSFNATGGKLMADDTAQAGGNIVNCRCTSTAPDVCSVGPTCASPASGGNFTPAKAVQPVPMTDCSTKCPNGVIDPGEECDDGNFDNSDACQSDCTRTCGNGKLDPGEQCDVGKTPTTCCLENCKAAPKNFPCVADTNECTTDACDGAGNCVATNNTDPCDDQDACTITDACGDGVCKGVQDCDKAGVVLLFDVSGSMSWDHNGIAGKPVDEQRITKAKQGGAFFVSLLSAFENRKPHLGVAEFPAHLTNPKALIGFCTSDSALVMTPLAAPADKTKVTDAIDLLHAGGDTPLVAGVKEARAMFAAEVNRAIVLLSDGYANCPSTMAKGDPDYDQLINDLKGTSPAPRVYTIGFGKPGDVDHPFLNGLATDTSGLFYDVTTPKFDPKTWDPSTDLKNTYKQILTNALGLQAASDPQGVAVGPGSLSFPVSINEHDHAAAFALNWVKAQNGRLKLAVRAADGTALVPGNPGVQLQEASTYAILSVDSSVLQQPGKVQPKPWQLEITGTQLAAGETEKFSYGVVLDSELRMAAAVTPETAYAGSVLTLSAKVTEVGKAKAGLTDVSVQIAAPREGLGNWLTQRSAVSAAAVTRVPLRFGGERLAPLQRRTRALTQAPKFAFPARASEIVLPLFDDGTHGDVIAGDGIYTNRFTDTAKDGTYAFRFSARGTTQGGNVFEREAAVQKLLSVLPSPGHSHIVIARASHALSDRVMVTATPRDTRGNALGPGHANRLVLATSAGRFVTPPVDNLDGTYRAELQLPEGMSAREVTIDVRDKDQSAAAAATMRRAPKRGELRGSREERKRDRQARRRVHAAAIEARLRRATGSDPRPLRGRADG